MTPVNFMAKLPTEELRSQFFRELMLPISDPLLTEFPTADEQQTHINNLFAKFEPYIDEQ